MHRLCKKLHKTPPKLLGEDIYAQNFCVKLKRFIIRDERSSDNVVSSLSFSAKLLCFWFIRHMNRFLFFCSFIDDSIGEKCQLENETMKVKCSLSLFFFIFHLGWKAGNGSRMGNKCGWVLSLMFPIITWKTVAKRISASYCGLWICCAPCILDSISDKLLII